MGIRIDEIVTVADCACHPIPVGTPNRIYVLFNFISSCPGKAVPPNGVTYTCKQDSVNPCLFFSGPDSAGRIASVQFFCLTNDVTIGLFIPAGDSFFFSLLNLPIFEYRLFVNNQVACGAGNAAFGGFAIVFWLSTVLDQVLFLNLPTDGDGLFLETFFVNPFVFINRYANTTYLLNKKVQFFR